MIIGSFVVLVLTAALVAPYFIDWASYREAFEREAGRILGRDVRVEGTARAILLPFPSLTFTDVIVAGAEPGEPAMTVDEFSMDAELAPFLSGELLIFDMRLVRPSATLEIDPSGGIDWAVRPSTPFDPRQVTLERVRITDGSLTIHQRETGRTIRVTDIDSELSARTVAGPWRMEGTLAVEGMQVGFSASTGTASEDGSMRVRVAAEPQNYPMMLEMDGQARFSEGAGLYAGTFRLEPPRRRDEDGRQIPAAPESNRLTGRFEINHQRLAIEEFHFATGPLEDPYTAEGTAEIDLGAEPSFSITADGAQLRLRDAEPGEEGVSSLSAEERLAALTRFLDRVPKPTIPGTVTLNLPAIVAGDTTIRDIRMQAEPVEQGWRIGSVAAVLPGRTHFEAEGLISSDAHLAFSGHMVLAIGQPSGFAAWLAKDVDDSIRRLPAAGFSADVSLTPDRQHFDNLELMLGDARFVGALDRRGGAQARPSLQLSLNGGRLDFEGMRAFASLFIEDEGQARLADHDLDLEISAGPVLAGGFEAESLDTALRLREGRLEIDKLTVNGLADANISATGQLTDMSTQPKGELDATIVAVDLAPLAKLLAQHLPAVPLFSALDRNAAIYPGLLEDTEINLIAGVGEEPGKVLLNVAGRAGGTGFSFLAEGDGNLAGFAAAPMNARFSARNEEAAHLYALFGLPAVPLGLAGAAEIEITASGRLDEGMDAVARFSGDGVTAEYQGRAGPLAKGDIPLDGRIELQSDDLEPWLAAAGVSLPGFGFGLPARFSAEIDYGNGLTVLNGLSGTFLGNPVSGDLNAGLRNGMPHVSGSLTVEEFDLRLMAEMVAGTAALEVGADRWPDAPFQQRSRAPLLADVELMAERLALSRALAIEEASLRLQLTENGVRVTGLSGGLFGGHIEGLGELRNNNGTGLFSAQVNLRGAALDDFLPSSGLTGKLQFSTSVTSSGKTVKAIVNSLSGSGSAALDDLRIAGLNPQALPRILEQADTLGPRIDAAAVAAFAPDLVNQGSLAAGRAQLAFTVANGVVRVPPVHLQAETAELDVEASSDLTEGTIAASGSVAFDPGEEQVGGSEAAVRFNVEGPVEAPAVRFDTEPLAQFLTQRALEREQERVERMQAVLLESQRLRRETRLFETLEAQRAAAEAERIRLEREEELRRKAQEEEARRAREEAQRRRIEAERRAAGEAPARPPAGNGAKPNPPNQDPPVIFNPEDANLERLLELFGPQR